MTDAGRQWRAATPGGQMGWRLPLNPDRPTDPLDAEGEAAVHGAALRLLRDTGVEITGAAPGRVLDAFRAAGARVEGAVVRFGEDVLAHHLSAAPAEFRLTPRNEARTIRIGGRHMVFTPVSSALSVWDIERGKRCGDFAAFSDFLRLAQSFNCIHALAGYPVEPLDIPAPHRHLACAEASLTLTDKVIHAYPLGAAEVEDVIELARLAAGLNRAEFEAAPRIMCNVNPASPLRYDARVLESAMACARAGQAVILTPFVQAGMNGPPHLAAAAAQALAEAMAGIALLQSVRPGAPVVLGSLVTRCGPERGVPVYGTGDYMRATQIMGQMARRLCLPFRASATSSAKLPDAQAMAETANSLWSAVQSGASLVFHAAGWLEGGAMASMEKFVIDCDLIQTVQRYFEAAPAPAGAEELAAAVLRAMGAEAPCSADAACPAPLVFDWRSHDAWHADGGLWTSERANRVARRMLEEAVDPPLDPGRAEAMADHVARRRREIDAAM